jgi:hypothetical protein
MKEFPIYIKIKFDFFVIETGLVRHYIVDLIRNLQTKIKIKTKENAFRKPLRLFWD